MNKRFFTVINCKDSAKEQPTSKKNLYLKAYTNTTVKITQIGINEILKESREYIKRLAFYGVKYIVALKYENREHRKHLDKKELEADFAFMDNVLMFMSLLTPRELVNIFPITKEYDGEKQGWKDYYYTIDTLKEYDMDKPVGMEQLQDLLWDYQNTDLWLFMGSQFAIMSDLRRCMGEKGIMEEWAEKQGISTYTLNKDNGYIVNNQNGEVTLIKKHNILTKVK